MKNIKGKTLCLFGGLAFLVNSTIQAVDLSPCNQNFASSQPMLASDSSQTSDLDEYQQLVIDKFNNILKNDSSSNWNTYEALKLTRGVCDQEMIYQFALGFMKSGQVGNARNFALRLTNPEMLPKRYQIAEMMIENRNPKNGIWILENMPIGYQLNGLGLLRENRYLRCADGFKTDIELEYINESMH